MDQEKTKEKHLMELKRQQVRLDERKGVREEKEKRMINRDRQRRGGRNEEGEDIRVRKT